MLNVQWQWWWWFWWWQWWWWWYAGRDNYIDRWELYREVRRDWESKRVAREGGSCVERKRWERIADADGKSFCYFALSETQSARWREPSIKQTVISWANSCKERGGEAREESGGQRALHWKYTRETVFQIERAT